MCPVEMQDAQQEILLFVKYNHFFHTFAPFPAIRLLPGRLRGSHHR